MELFDKKFVYLEWDDVLQGKEVFVADTLPELRRCVENDDNRPTIEKNDGIYPFATSGSRVYYAFVYYDPNYECKRAFLEGKEVECLDGFGNWILMTSIDPWFDDRRSYRVKPEDSDSCLLIINDRNEVGIVKEGREWKGRLIKKGTEEECKDYIVNNYCNKCVHQLSLSCGAFLGCQGFKEREKVECDSCQYQGMPDTENPCMTCVGYNNYKPRVVVKHKHKRRMTNRELAQWVAGGWGECLQNTIAFTSWNYLTENKDKIVSDGIKIRGWDETEWREPEVEG